MQTARQWREERNGIPTDKKAAHAQEQKMGRPVHTARVIEDVKASLQQ